MSNTAATPRVLGINHLGLAPKDPVRARWFFVEALGLPDLGDETVPSQKTHTVMIAAFAGDGAGRAPERLEILAPAPPGEGAIAKFLEKKGGGIHHVALTVVGLEAWLERLTSLGVRLIDDAPRPGAHGTRVAFVHPEGTGGLLVELVEEA